MEKNPFKWPLAVIAGILIWLSELIFNLPAVLLWPGGYSPLKNSHSDLGGTGPHPTRGSLNSPLGAQFYNSGQVFLGLAIILFAGGLYMFYTEERWKKTLLILGQIFGILAGIVVIMNGIYSIDFQPQHGQWSQVLFISIFLAELFVNISLLYHSEIKKPIPIFGLIAAVLNLLIVALYDILDPPFLLEFIAIYIAETWIGLIAINIFYNEVWLKQ